MSRIIFAETQIELSKQKSDIFTDTALNALYNASKGNPRRLNSLIINCLIIGYQNQKEIIDDGIVMMAKNEIDFMGV